jgi:AcrR family transcriptional regulator
VSTRDLLDAALDAFAERGFEGTSVRELARGLGVSHNLIPQRIGSKDELWIAAVDQAFARLALALADVIASLGLQEDVDDVATLRAVVVRFVEVNCSRPALLRIIQQEASAPGPRFDHLFERYIDPVRIFGSELLVRLREAGRVRTDDVSLLYFFMTNGAGGPLSHPAIAERFGVSVDPNDPEAVRAHANAAVDLLFDGLLTEPGSA